MEKIVGVGCRFWMALKRLKLCIFGKNWKLGYPETRTQPTKSKKKSGFKRGSGTRGNLQGIFLLNQATVLRFALF